MEKSFEQLANEVNEVFNRVAPEQMNCRHTVIPEYVIDNIFAGVIEEKFFPERILKNGVATIVFWKDGSKTVVKCASGETPNYYDAFTAALAVKIFGNNSRLKKMIKEKTVIQKGKK